MTIAIYSRKSKFTGKGESIENQIIKCQKFIEFKFSDEITEKDIEIYVDEGFSGKNENRPKYQEMISKVRNGKINKIIIYQLNRLGRNARDIHNTMEMCTSLNCIIYSATEGFDSSTSFGRAIIGILASLAQLEREQIAERVKDNMYTLAKMGRWLGGQSPLGFNYIRETYKDENMKERSLALLRKNTEELKLVKKVYDKYLDEKSLSQVSKWSLTNNFRGKNGGNLDKSAINIILQNPVYVQSNQEVCNFLEKLGYEVCGDPNGNGILRYGKGEEKIAAISKHKGIIPADKWLKVQEIIKENTSKAPRLGKTNTALLTGILKCQCGSGMRVTYGHKRCDGTKTFYYTCSMKNNSGGTRCKSKNINGQEVEKLVIDKIKIRTAEDICNNLKTLTNSLDIEENTNKVNKLNEEKDLLKKKIDNLINKLSLTSDNDISKLFINQISLFKSKILEIDKQIDEFKNIEAKIAEAHREVNNNIKKLDEFKNNFDYMNFEEKKRCLNDMLEKITWNSDSNEIVLKYN
ncbi:DNA invertase Pin-like site-specific DNA recombinase [Clostridium moniliforme]|uniref:DNA invertase Pin-like site-specific DNA recombinase n=1 Tax=Clostridium moniliforme TaxID=39489 RepID=A0ABS4F0V2_9CLOT|nr:recombinase family protein [Clostridium moniliforme]MBP1889888.1 DNA invertase Pin-like site-specific DNA recombinase [Clostridium moniliforme]